MAAEGESREERRQLEQISQAKLDAGVREQIKFSSGGKSHTRESYHIKVTRRDESMGQTSGHRDKSRTRAGVHVIPCQRKKLPVCVMRESDCLSASFSSSFSSAPKKTPDFALTQERKTQSPSARFSLSPSVLVLCMSRRPEPEFRLETRTRVDQNKQSLYFRDQCY